MSLFAQSGSVVNSNNVGASSNKKSYQQLLDANPYRNITYNKSPWQNFLSQLGFRTQADAWQENMDIQAREYDAAILQKQYDEEYNDPQSQVARERAAGLNPDINGGQSIDPGSAAPLGEDPSTPMQTTGEEGLPMQIVNGVMSAFTTGMGIVSSFQGVQSKHLDNLLKVEGFASDNFSKFIPFLGISNSDDLSQSRGRSDVISDSLEMAKMFAKSNLPRRYRDKFVQTIQGFWNSAPGDAEAFKSWTDQVKSGRSYGVESQYLYSPFSDVLLDLTKPLSGLADDIAKLNLKYQKSDLSAGVAENENREEYANALDADLQGRTENVANDLQLKNNEMVGLLRGRLNEIIHGLEDTAKNNNGLKGGLANVCITLISMLQLWLSSQGAPSISRSTSFSSGSGADRQSYSQSFSLGL